MIGTIEFFSKAYFTDEPENFLIDIAGSVFLPGENHEEDDEDEILAGKLHAFYVDVAGASDAGFDLDSILDLDSEAEECSTIFDGKTQEFVESIESIVHERPIAQNLLFFTRLEILPAYRGQGLGLYSLFRCMQQFTHGVGIVALKCVPRQFLMRKHESAWEKMMNLDAFDRKKEASRQKLEKYFKRLGFRKMPDTQLLVLNPEMRQPSLKDMGLEA